MYIFCAKLCGIYYLQNSHRETLSQKPTLKKQAQLSVVMPEVLEAAGRKGRADHVLRWILESDFQVWAT